MIIYAGKILERSIFSVQCSHGLHRSSCQMWQQGASSLCSINCSKNEYAKNRAWKISQKYNQIRSRLELKIFERKEYFRANILESPKNKVISKFCSDSRYAAVDLTSFLTSTILDHPFWPIFSPPILPAADLR